MRCILNVEPTSSPIATPRPTKFSPLIQKEDQKDAFEKAKNFDQVERDNVKILQQYGSLEQQFKDGIITEERFNEQKLELFEKQMLLIKKKRTTKGGKSDKMEEDEDEDAINHNI
eukprot:154366_1